MADPIESTGKVVGNTAGKASSSALGKQMGPLPLGAWIVVIGGSLAVAFVLANRNAKKDAAATTTQPPTALVYTGSGNQVGTDAAPNTSAGTFQTNEQWATAAKTYLIAQGYDGAKASSAVDKYINAQPLTAQENAMISIAIKGIGPTPQSLPPVTGDQPAPEDPYTTFASAHVGYQTSVTGEPSMLGTVYTVTNDDLANGQPLANIARKAFQIAPTDYSNLTFAMDQILNTNWQKIPDVKNIPAGTMLYIPVLSSQEFPNFGDKIPLLGWRGVGTDAKELEFQIGAVPTTAATGRTGH